MFRNSSEIIATSLFFLLAALWRVPACKIYFGVIERCDKQMRLSSRWLIGTEPMDKTVQAALAGYRLHTAFEREQQRLSEPSFAAQVAKPLAFWARTQDRFLPKSMLSRPVREIIETPFSQLRSTPGIGERKLHNLIALLSRIVHPARNGTALEVAPTWEAWRQVVLDCDLERETFGRLAFSLQTLPSSLWHQPLAKYAHLSSEELNELSHDVRTAIIDVFRSAAECCHNFKAVPHLSARIRPKLVLRLDASKSDASLTAEAIRAEIVEPLLALIRHDGGQVLARAIATRLENIGRPVSEISRLSGLSAQQLRKAYADAKSLAAARWPEGRKYVAAWHENQNADAVRLLRELRLLVFGDDV